MELRTGRIMLIDPCDATREVLATRLRAQGYTVDTTAEPSSGAFMALSAPPAAVIGDLWMPSISGFQLCMLLRSEPATATVPVILRGDVDDPRNRFWAERAGARAYVAKGRMGDLLRALSAAIVDTSDDGFFLQLSEGNVDIRDRIARQLDTALFNAAIASEVRALASSDSFERLFDSLSQFVSQVGRYRWLAISTRAPERFAIHHHPAATDRATIEAREALDIDDLLPALHIEDEDAISAYEGEATLVRSIGFGGTELGRLAIGGWSAGEGDTGSVATIIAKELGGAIRMATLVEEMRSMASIDPLTKIMNRRAFGAAASVEIARCHRHGYPLGIALLDIDHFKQVNDRRGHAAGDQVLAEVGASILRSIRREDMAARWGGEEFVVGFTSSGREGSILAGERLRGAIEDLVITDGKGARIDVTASVGIALLRAGEDLESLVARADAAMYASKAGGRNRVTFADGDAERWVA